MIDQLEQDPRFDPAVEIVGRIAEQVSAGPGGPILRGEWLGHALHPLLTDFPLGCWLSAGLLDVVGGRSRQRAAQRLVALGLFFAGPTMLAGLAEFATLPDQRSRRVAAVHAIGNTAVGGAYFLSWRARRRGHHGIGIVLGMAGGTLAWGTGYLGGHLSFARGAGVGTRGIETTDATPAA